MIFLCSTIRPVDSRFVFAIGEGWHNYHHSFPWDYRAAEFGTRYSFSTFVIDILAEFGMAYDLREAPYKMVEHRAVKKGDGSHPIFGKKHIYRIRTEPNLKMTSMCLIVIIIIN